MAKAGRPGVKIFCINDRACYSSLAEAARHYNIASSSISKQLKGQRATVGGRRFIKISESITLEELEKIREDELQKFYNIFE